MRPPAFASPGRWFRGNLDTHSDRSDGVAPPEQVIAGYRAAGYDFLVLTDHFETRWGPARAIALTGIHGWRSAVAEGDPT